MQYVSGGYLRAVLAALMLGAATSAAALTVTTPGTVLENQTYTSDVVIKAADVTVRNCDFVGATLSLAEEADRARVLENRFRDHFDAALVAIPAIAGDGSIPDAARDVIVRGNDFERVSLGLSMWGTGWLVEHNRVWDLLERDGDNDYMRVGGHNNVYRRNLFGGSRKSELVGAHVDGFQHFNAPFTNSIIEENIVMGFDQAVFIKAPDQGDQSDYQGIVVRNNVFVGRFADGTDGGGLGVSFKNNTSSPHWENMTVINNTFIDHWNIGVSAFDDSGTIRNNIFYDVKNALRAQFPMEIDHNLYWPNDDSEAGPNAVVADPQLRDPGNILGPDGLPFTADDGWRALGSVAEGKGAQINPDGSGTTNDPDYDGLTTEQENQIGTNPNDWDSDDDGYSDGTEVANGTDPLDSSDPPPPPPDSDGDGLNDEQEASLGTNPNVADTDGDGVNDGTEVANGTDPLDPADPPAPEPVSGALRVSLSADRSNATLLNGATFDPGTSLYIFFDPSSGNGDGIDTVQFFLNGQSFWTESAWPYDFHGGSKSSASPWSGAEGSFTVQAYVNGVLTTSATFALGADPGDPTPDPPVAGDDRYSVDRDSDSTVFEVLANDTGDGITIVDLGVTDNGGSVGLAGGTALLYTPAADYVGTETFSYTIQDSVGQQASALVTVTVNDTNDPPTPADDTVEVEMASTGNVIDVLANDTDPDPGDTLNITSLGTPNQGGAATLGAGQTVLYTPASSFEGTDTFSYTVADPDGAAAIATVQVNVKDMSPTANDDSYQVDANTPATTFNVLTNDAAYSAGDVLTITGVDSAANASNHTIQAYSDYVTYAPEANFSGQDTFTYTVQDSKGRTATATVHVNVGVPAPVTFCDDYSIIVAKLDRLRTDFPAVTTDIDGDGVDDGAMLDIMRSISCQEPKSSLSVSVDTAYAVNLLALEAEALATDLSPYREAIAAMFAKSLSAKASLTALLDAAGWTLTGTYESVLCDAEGVCMPQPIDGVPLSEGYLTFENTRTVFLQPFTVDGDLDADTLTNGEELTLGTDPLSADSDEDGYDDAVELEAGSDPNDANSTPDVGGSTGTLLVSMSSDRSNSNDLQSAELVAASPAYIYFSPDAGSNVSSVAFFLDGEFVWEEGAAPYDFAGGSVNEAAAWFPTAGSHTIEAVVDGTLAASASFTVVESTPDGGSTIGVLMYSLSEDRSNPLPLAGAQFPSGTSLYIFYEHTSQDSISYVKFLLDGKNYWTERKAPYDFNKGNYKTANAWNPADGVHQIGASVDGNLVTQVTFTVGN